MYASFSTNTSVNTPISGLGAGDTINKVELVWILLGTDDTGRTDLTNQTNLANSAAAAIAAGRTITLTAGVHDSDIAAFQTTAGATGNVGTLTNGASYVPAVRVTENKNGGGTQAGAWTKGTSVTYGTTTTTTTAAPTSTTTTTAPTTTTAAPSIVYTFDGSNGAAPEAAFTVTTAGGGTGTLDGSGALKMASAADADGALAFLTSSITPASSRKYKVRFKAQIGNVTDNGIVALAIKYDSGSPGLPGTFGYPLNPSIIVDGSGNHSMLIKYFNASSVAQFWNQTAGNWTATLANGKFAITANTWYWMELTTTATGFSYTLYSAGTSTAVGTALMTTTEIPWSGVLTVTGTPRIVIGGDYLTSEVYGTIYIDTFVVE